VSCLPGYYKFFSFDESDFLLPSKAEVHTTVDKDSDILGRENLSVGK
jgi:hypothetical protein